MRGFIWLILASFILHGNCFMTSKKIYINLLTVSEMNYVIVSWCNDIQMLSCVVAAYFKLSNMHSTDLF